MTGVGRFGWHFLPPPPSPHSPLRPRGSQEARECGHAGLETGGLPPNGRGGDGAGSDRLRRQRAWDETTGASFLSTTLPPLPSGLWEEQNRGPGADTSLQVQGLPLMLQTTVGTATIAGGDGGHGTTSGDKLCEIQRQRVGDAMPKLYFQVVELSRPVLCLVLFTCSTLLD